MARAAHACTTKETDRTVVCKLRKGMHRFGDAVVGGRRLGVNLFAYVIRLIIKYSFLEILSSVVVCSR